MKQIDRSKLPAPSVLTISTGSADWVEKSKLPKKRGWYVTRSEDGKISWRVWGNHAWWKQCRDGWIKSFTGNGEAMDYEWLPSTRKSVKLDVWTLPTLQNIQSRRMQSD